MGEERGILEGRVKILATVLAICLLALLTRTAYLQVIEGEKLERHAKDQTLRVLTIPAARGSILDRNGIALATTRPAFAVTLLPTRTGYSRDAIGLLAEFLNTDQQAIEEAIRRQALPYAPVVVKVDITPREHTLIAENQDRLPGVMIEAWPLRHYPHGSLASHVLGYVGMGTGIEGRAGVEGRYDALLAGTPGARQVEVDHRARFVSAGGKVEPQSGADIRLTIDSNLQATAEKALAVVLERLALGIDPMPRDPRTGLPRGLLDEGTWLSLPRDYPTARAGAVVVMDVRTGAILAMASAPDFDPNRFSLATHYLRGTEEWRDWQREWTALSGEQPHRLLNRTIQSAYAPGSVFKIVTALAGLEIGLVDVDQTVRCTGSHGAYGLDFACWSVHGTVDFIRSLAASCNVYYYQLGQRIGIDNLAAAARQMRLGMPTGLVGLNETERTGVVASRDWKERELSERWYPPETFHAAIGQGFHLYTPLQMAVLMGAVANGGTILRPYVIDRVLDPGGEVIESYGPEVVGDLGVSAANLELVRQGLLAATQPGGTAHWRFWDYPKTVRRLGEGAERVVQVAAKTGTVELTGHLPHGHFVAFAPYDEPEIAVVVLVEHGGGGYLAGGPVAHAVIEAYFGFDRPQTPGREPEREPGPFDVSPR